MAFDDYLANDDGSITFTDTFSGKTLTAGGVEAKRKAFEIDQQRALSTDWGQAQLQAGLDDATAAERARRTAEAGGQSQGGPNMSVEPLPPTAPAGQGGAPGAPAPHPGGAPGAPPYEPPPLEPAGQGGAPQAPPAPPPLSVGSGGLAEQGAGMGGPVAPAPAPAPPASPGAPGSAGAGGGVSYSSKAAPRPGGGGGGAMGAPKLLELPSSRTVQVQGALKPQTRAELEALARRGADLQKGRLSVEEAQKEEDLRTARALGDVEKIHDDRARETRDKGTRELGEMQARRAAKLAEIEKGEVDPQKFWGGMSAGRKAGAIAAIFVGGLAQGLGGGPNEALQILDKAVDRDIDAQKTNLQKRQWEASELGQLYEMRRRQLGDDLAARNEVKALALAQVKRQAQQLAMLTNAPAIQQKYAEFEFAADEQIARLHAAEDAKYAESKSYAYKAPGGGGGGAAPKKPGRGVTLLMRGKDGKITPKFVPLKDGLSKEEIAEATKRAAANNNWVRGTVKMQELHGVGAADSDFRTVAQDAVFGKDTALGQGQSTEGAIDKYMNNVRGVGGEKAIKQSQRSALDNAEEMVTQYGAMEE